MTYSGGGQQATPAVAVAAEALGVEAPWTAPKWMWSWAWRGHKALLPLFHRFDAAAPENTCVNLQVLWLKALAGDEEAYSMLPGESRLLVSKPLRRFYPLLHHQNTLMRATYLESAVGQEIDADTLVVTLGAGFCTRSLRLSRGGNQCVEIDLPSVVEQKQNILKDRKISFDNVHFVAANLSSTPDVALDLALSRGAGCGSVVFVVEALLIYLDIQSARRLLRTTLDVAADYEFDRVSLCFADRLPGMSRGVEQADVRRVLAETGWTELIDYIPKPGLARHMGIARRRPVQ